MNEFMASVRVASSQESAGTHNPPDHNALGIPTADQQRMATQQRVQEWNAFMESMRANESSLALSQEATGTHNSTDRNALGIPTDDRQRIATQQRVRELNEFMAFVRTNESSRVPRQEPTGLPELTGRNTFHTPASDHQDIERGFASRQRMQELPDRTRFARTNESSRVPGQEPTGPSESTSGNTLDTPIGAGDRRDIAQGRANRQRVQELLDLTYLARANDPSGMPNQQALTDAVDMLIGMHDTDLTDLVGRNGFYVIEHLRDIGVLPSYQLAAPVQQAARNAHNDPEQLVRNLLALVTADPPLLPVRHRSSSPSADRPAEAGGTSAGPSGMPSQAVLTDAVGMLMGLHDVDLRDLAGSNALNVIEHLHDIQRLPSDRLAPRVRQAARDARNDPQQLVLSLLALVTADSPLLPARPRSTSSPVNRPAETGGTPAGPSGMPSQAVLTDAVGMLMGLHDVDLRDLAGSNALNVIEHLHDIQRLPSDRLAPRVRQAARDARNDPQQLVLSLLALVTADSPLLPARPRSTSSPVNRRAEAGGTSAGPSGMPSQAVLTDAVGMLMGLHDVDLRDLAGSNALNVIEHLHDIQRLPSDRLAPRVRQAARDARNDPQQLVLSLLALVTADSPLLPARPRSTSSPVNRRAEAGGTSAGPSGMPSQAVLTDAVGMLMGLHDVDLRDLAGSNALNVIEHLHDIQRLPSDRLAPRVRQAARDARNDPQQLVLSLLALATADSPLLPARPRSTSSPVNRPAEAGGTSAGPLGMPSRELLNDAVGRLTILRDRVARRPDRPSEQLNMIGLVIEHLRSDQLAPFVQQAAREANNDSHQLVRYLLRWVTEDPSLLLPAHRPAEAGGTSAGSSGMPSREVLTDAVGMLMDLHEVDLRDLAGPNGLNVIEHLHDIQRLPSDRLAPSVRQAALDAHNDAEQLVRNLLALVTADSPLLPARPRSSS
ncbi:hypothetical protein [Ralstonia solanacearum]|uniref:hypothetical protein n=1 Tax=Ralstonia solanacearum TaxID=305 RepID=UPI0018D1BEE4|nr:hypothetical protein [Ralstonia solanacearum]